jgi:hypothetical protein
MIQGCDILVTAKIYRREVKGMGLLLAGLLSAAVALGLDDD